MRALTISVTPMSVIIKVHNRTKNASLFLLEAFKPE